MAGTLPFPPEALQMKDQLLDLSAGVPPEGVAVNLENPQNHHQLGFGASLACLVLATIAVGVRILTRKLQRWGLNGSDYTAIVGWGFFCGIFAMGELIATKGSGVHQWDMRLRDLIDFLMYFWIASLLYCFCIFAVKVSILLQYLRIFVSPKEKNTMFYCCHVLIWTNAVFYLILIFILVFACFPVQKIWDPFVQEGYCLDVLSVHVASAAINAASDLIILILPQISIWSLHLTSKKKAQISVVFLFAGFATASSIARTVYAVFLHQTTDITYRSWQMMMWVPPEIAGGLIAASLPEFAKFAQIFQQSKLGRQIFGSSIPTTRTDGPTLGATATIGDTTVIGTALTTDEPILSERETQWGEGDAKLLAEDGYSEKMSERAEFSPISPMSVGMKVPIPPEYRFQEHVQSDGHSYILREDDDSDLEAQRRVMTPSVSNEAHERLEAKFQDRTFFRESASGDEL